MTRAPFPRRAACRAASADRAAHALCTTARRVQVPVTFKIQKPLDRDVEGLSITHISATGLAWPQPPADEQGAGGTGSAAAPKMVAKVHE